MSPAMIRNYAIVTVALTSYFGFLTLRVSEASVGVIDGRALLPPIFALVALTGAVWIVMLLMRNVLVAVGKVSMRYYETYNVDAPPDWVERPARTFMNLLELPVLFYVACLLMLVTNSCDAAHVALAWMFVATRVLHALIYIVFNHVPSRFGAYVAGSVTLAVIWVRLASQLL